jgi:hypothetical protein
VHSHKHATSISLSCSVNADVGMARQYSTSMRPARFLSCWIGPSRLHPSWFLAHPAPFSHSVWVMQAEATAFACAAKAGRLANPGYPVTGT